MSVEEVLGRMITAVGGKTQGDLGKALGISQSGVSDAKRKGKVPPEWVVRLSAEHNLNPNWLLTGKGPMYISEATPSISAGPELRGRVPLISWVQAGEWTEVIDNLQPGDAEEFLPVTSSVGPHAFALRVVGNSMEPEFREGEIVIVDPGQDAETGSFVVAKISNDEATFKQLIKDGGSVFLRPLNSAYPVMDVTGRELRIVGRIVEKVKRY